MKNVRKEFYERLKSRNEQQLEAITSIDGPVMVIAGPGTGKTDVLGLRIGYILENTDTELHNILCLTYTEAGAVEMRKRLLDYVGPTAYNAQVYTFHGFCNMVIHENIEHFGIFREHQPISDLEQFQILKEIIDRQPMGHPLKRYTGQIYYETRRLKKLFDTMKLEQWSAEEMHAAIDKWVDEMRESPDFQYKRAYKGYKKGDLKEREFEKKVIAPMEVLKSGVDCFDTYNALLREKGRYDYHDMLTWVHDQFKANDTLLARYQERFQYFLVDEFQDSNGIQMALLNLLLSQWGSQSDVFIVGDDDQSIFRFQGAMMQNILQFKEQYNPAVIVLTGNYRSTQNILDAASQLIECNTERLVVQYPQYTKNLTAMAAHADAAEIPEVRVFPNKTQESATLLKELTELHENGTLKSQSVAVIYRQHRQVEEIVHALEIREVPINVKRPVNILERPMVRNILTVLDYIALEIEEYGSGEYLLYEMLRFPFFGISARDAGILALEKRRMQSTSHTFWRDILSSKKLLASIGVENIEAVTAFDELLDFWIGQYEQYTALEMLEQIMSRGGVLKFIFNSPNRSWHLQLVKTLFDHVKDQVMRSPDMTIRRLLDDIELMREHGIELPVNKVLSAPNGIHFVTAHSAKGMQFDKVYMIGCTKRIWDSGRGGSGEFKLPGNLSPVSAGGDEEDERRLFYVGMTRARKELVMSYPLLDDNEREQESSRFIQEILDGGKVKAENAELSEIDFAHYCVDLMQPIEVRLPVIEHALLDQVLDNFVLSVSALNTYLECPRKFYFTNILRLPTARHSYFGLGKAIHKAIESFFRFHVKDHQVNANSEQLVAYYQKCLRQYRGYFTRQQFDLAMHLGEEMLVTYFTQRVEEWKKADRSDLELKINDAEHRGVPIKGVLDRVDHYRDMVTVTDYKSGKASNARNKVSGPSDRDAQGGDYWRQIVFYKILVDASPHITKPMPVGYIDFVRPSSSGEHKLQKVIVTDDDANFVSDQIVDTYEKIMGRKFDTGCNEPECYWCNLAKSHTHFENEFAFSDEEIDL